MILKKIMSFGGDIMLRILGSILVILSTTILGFIYSDSFKKRVSQLNEFQRSINQLENEITYTHEPLPDTFKNISERSSFPINSIFKDISGSLLEGKYDNVYEAFNASFDKYRNQIDLKKDDINIIIDLSKSLGESDIEGQKKLFAMINENLKKQIAAAEESMKKNVKIYRYLGFGIGSVMVIILI